MSEPERLSLARDGAYQIAGAMTFETAPELLGQCERWLGAGSDGVTIDLAQVTRIDSAGLALMIEWLRRARLAGRELRFVNLPEQTQHLIRVAGLQALFPGHR